MKTHNASGSIHATIYRGANDGIGAPVAGLTVDEAMSAVEDVLGWHGLSVDGNANAGLHKDLRARLTAAIEQKNRKP